MNQAEPIEVEPVEKRIKEHAVATELQAMLKSNLTADYVVHVGKSILYKIEVNALGKVSIDSVDSPRRGQYAFQTDILIESRVPSIPLVVIELKSGSFSSHDVITYSAKATQHKNIYPYLRYGFVVVGPGALGRRFITHNQGFDFATAVLDLASKEKDLLALIRRQIASAERLGCLAQSGRLRISRYEEIVDIGD